MKLKDKLNDNELDLSLSELSEVPVREMLALPKATHVDLSCNRIKILPPNFISLTHIIKLDLSKNELSELPPNFGNLHNLQYLDLYGNKLSSLPTSFCRLKSLHWLDLKNNPLEGQLKSIAGDCLDQKQCQQCARKIVTHMQAVESEREREKQKRLKEEREKEAATKAKELKAQETARKLKKAEKERRKAELREERLRQQEEEKRQEVKEKELSETKNSELNGVIIRQPNQKKSGFWISCFITSLLLPMVVIGAAVVIHLYMGHRVETYDDIQNALEESWKIVREYSLVVIEIIKGQILQLKELLLIWMDNAISYWNQYHGS